ncbi:MAG: hypothetical protein Fur0037_14820 [Planctomycetota bacterium]
MNHALIEIEESTLAACVADVGRDRIEVRAFRRMRIGTAPGEDLASLLGKLVSDLGQSVRKAHVLLGDRRCHHFALDVPPLSLADLAGLVEREAARAAGLPPATGMLMRARLLGPSSRGRRLIGITALARDVWAPIARALEQSGIEVLSLATVEDGLGLAVDRSLPARTAVVEYSGGRARFVVCDHGAPTQVRRFLVSGFESGGDVEPAMLAAQLAMEVPRTLEYLAEHGRTKPEALVLSRNLGLSEEDLEVFTDQGIRCVLARPVFSVPEGEPEPDLAIAGRLESLRRGVRLRSLTDPLAIERPVSRALIASAAALLVTGTCGMWLGFGRLSEIDRLAFDLAHLRMERDRLARIDATLEIPHAGGIRQASRAILDSRRPASRLLGELCNATPPSCILQRVDFDGETGVSVEGRISADSRVGALAGLREFAEGIARIPFVKNKGPEDVGQLDSAAKTLRFRLALAWRKS